MTDLQQLAGRVLALEERMAQLEARSPNEVVQPVPKLAKKVSVKEFIISKRPSNDVERTLAIGYFLERYMGATSFSVDDLSRHFELAKEAIPLNINDKVNLNIKKGHLTEAREKKDKKKAWIVTNSGERFVENSFKDSEK